MLVRVLHLLMPCRIIGETTSTINSTTRIFMSPTTDCVVKAQLILVCIRCCMRERAGLNPGLAIAQIKKRIAGLPAGAAR